MEDAESLQGAAASNEDIRLRLMAPSLEEFIAVLRHAREKMAVMMVRRWSGGKILRRRGRAGQATEPAQANATTSIIDGLGRRGGGAGQATEPSNNKQDEKRQFRSDSPKASSQRKTLLQESSLSQQWAHRRIIIVPSCPPPFPPKNNLKPEQLTSLKSTSAT